MTKIDHADIQVIAPNFKRRLSGVTATVVRLVPVQACDIAIVATGPALPADVPQIPLSALLKLPRRGPDGARVWHARRNTEMLGGLALKFLLGKKLKLLFTSASQREQTWLTRWLIRQMDAVVATSARTASYLQVPNQVIMHGIDTDGFSPAADRATLRQKLGLPDALLLGCYGRIRAQKGTDAFVEALIPVMHENEEVHGLVMGRATGPHQAFEQGLKDRVKDAGLADRFHFLPEVPVEQMADWYRVLDLYVAPQRWEGFGLTPIEAMACGVPCIATRVGAFETLVVEGETGALVPPDDIPALSKAVQSAVQDPAVIARWATKSRPHVQENYSIAREAAELTTLYRKLLSASG